MILVLDCETTGLPRDYQAPVTDFDNWPRAVQIAWACFDDQGQFLRKANHIIFPDGFEIPEAATAKHGITTVQAQTEGVMISDALRNLENDMVCANWIVAHNMDFDASVLGSEFLRAGYKNGFDTADTICTMRASTDFCAIPGPHGYKWPKLSELYAVLFDGAVIEGEHDAEIDTLACAKCFFALVDKGVITLEKEWNQNTNTQASEPQDLLEEELNFDEPAAALFAPLELQQMLQNAYNWQTKARFDLFNMARVVEFRRRELRQKQTTLRLGEAYGLLKNAEMRETYLSVESAEQISALDAAEDDLSLARVEYENASAEVEQARALLRVAELAAYSQRQEQSYGEVMAGLLIPDKAG